MSTRKWPATSIRLRPISELLPYANNARTHSDDQVRLLARSLLKFGWTNAILVDEAGVVIAGHGRLLGAGALVKDGHADYSEAPVIEAVGWSEEEKAAYRVADNQLALVSGWDRDLLAAELQGLSAGGFDMKLLGFSRDDLHYAMRGKGAGLTDPDALPGPGARSVARLGETWQLGEHRIRCGSSIDPADVAALLDGRPVNLMVTDPPYGVKYDPKWRADVRPGGAKAVGEVLNDDRADWREAWELFPGNVAYVWHGGLHSGTVQDSLAAAGFECRAQIIWVKDRMILSRGAFHWQHEPCWYAVRKGQKASWTGGRKRTTVVRDVRNATAEERTLVAEIIEAQGAESTVWEIPVSVDDGSTGHGTQKPVACMARPIECNSKPGEFVYEPFSGSGSTIIAGQMTARSVLAMELVPSYVDLAIRRWQNFTGGVAVREDGITFLELEAAQTGSGDDEAWT